jgi:hypothetical protein
LRSSASRVRASGPGSGETSGRARCAVVASLARAYAGARAVRLRRRRPRCVAMACFWFRALIGGQRYDRPRWSSSPSRDAESAGELAGWSRADAIRATATAGERGAIAHRRRFSRRTLEHSSGSSRTRARYEWPLKCANGSRVKRRPRASASSGGQRIRSTRLTSSCLWCRMPSIGYHCPQRPADLTPRPFRASASPLPRSPRQPSTSHRQPPYRRPRRPVDVLELVSFPGEGTVPAR